MPSRTGIYCGRLPHRCGVLQQAPLSRDSVCIARYLSDNRYRTALVGHLNIIGGHEWAGFQEAVQHHEDVAAGKSFFSGIAGGKPFFAHVSHGLVHRSYGQEYDQELVKRIPVPPVLPDNLTTRRDLASLALNVTELDRRVGFTLDALDAAGLTENTLVIFTTDHGVALARHKHTLYDPGIRTALLMRLPGVIKPESVHDQLLSNVDLFPTVCDLAGVPVPNDLDGRSFVTLFKGEAGPMRTSAFAEVNWARRGGALCYGPHRCLRTDRYKLIRNFHSEPCYLDGGFVGRYANDLDVLNNWPLFGNPCPTHELYDIVADPWEMANLADDPAHEDALLDLDMELNKLMEDTGDPAFHGKVPSQTDEPVKPQWAKGDDGVYRLDYDLETETKERPFQQDAAARNGRGTRSAVPQAFLPEVDDEGY